MKSKYRGFISEKLEIIILILSFMVNVNAQRFFSSINGMSSPSMGGSFSPMRQTQFSRFNSATRLSPRTSSRFESTDVGNFNRQPLTSRSGFDRFESRREALPQRAQDSWDQQSNFLPSRDFRSGRSRGLDPLPFRDDRMSRDSFSGVGSSVSSSSSSSSSGSRSASRSFQSFRSSPDSFDQFSSVDTFDSRGRFDPAASRQSSSRRTLQSPRSSSDLLRSSDNSQRSFSDFSSSGSRSNQAVVRQSTSSGNIAPIPQSVARDNRIVIELRNNRPQTPEPSILDGLLGTLTLEEILSLKLKDQGSNQNQGFFDQNDLFLGGSGGNQGNSLFDPFLSEFQQPSVSSTNLMNSNNNNNNNRAGGAGLLDSLLNDISLAGNNAAHSRTNDQATLSLLDSLLNDIGPGARGSSSGRTQRSSPVNAQPPPPPSPPQNVAAPVPASRQTTIIDTPAVAVASTPVASTSVSAAAPAPVVGAVSAVAAAPTTQVANQSPVSATSVNAIANVPSPGSAVASAPAVSNPSAGISLVVQSSPLLNGLGGGLGSGRGGHIRMTTEEPLELDDILRRRLLARMRDPNFSL